MYYYRLISSMLKAVISSLGTGLYAVYKGESNALASLTTSLYAVYKGESNANDSLGNYNGTPQGGLTYTAGKSGNAFVFNGTNAYVQLPDNSLNSLTGSFSISLWFKTGSSVSNIEYHLLDNISMNTWYNNPNGFDIIHYGNSIFFDIYNNTNTAVGVSANYTFLPNTWYHIVATKLINGNMNVYINGVLNITKVTTVNPTYLATISKPCIGAMNVPARTPAVGYYAQNGSQVDELNIWTKELTATEVTELYNSGNGKFYQGNAFYSTVVNDSLLNYNGTAQGGLTYSGGKSGNAFTFNGTSAYVQLPDNSLNFLTSFTIGWWMNLGGTSLDAQQPISNAQRSAGGSTIWGYGVYIQNSIINFQVMDGTNYVALTWNMASINNWAYFEIEREWNVGSKIRVNGSVVASNTSTINPAYRLDVVHTPAIGVYKNTTGNNYFMSSGGKIDEVNIWNRLLTATEVTELYNAGAGKFYPY